jgi:single-strand DNA-binding protein
VSEGLNQVTLIGNLGADPEWRNTGESGVLQLRLATTESYLDRNRQRKEITEWHTVVVWGRRGEALAKLLSKGSKIAVTGNLRTSSWEAQDGSGKRYRTQIVARNVLLCGGGGQQRSGGGSPPPDDFGGPQGFDYGGPPEDDIPF